MKNKPIKTVPMESNRSVSYTSGERDKLECKIDRYNLNISLSLTNSNLFPEPLIFIISIAFFCLTLGTTLDLKNYTNITTFSITINTPAF